MTNAGGCSTPGKRSSHGQGKLNRLKSTSRMAATVTSSGRGLMRISSSLAVGQGCRAPHCSNTRSMTASRGHVHDADALFSTNLVRAHREGRSPLFTENREGFLLGNLASAKYYSRKLRASGGVEKGRSCYTPALVVSDTLLKLTNLP